MQKNISSVVIALFYCTQGFSQSDSTFNFLPIEQWAGKEFIFLPKPIAMQLSGYAKFSVDENSLSNLSYQENAGKILRIDSIFQQSGIYHLRCTILENNQRIIASSAQDYLDGIALKQDIEKAKSLYKGKTFWYKGRDILKYSEPPGVGKIMVFRFSAMQIVDVIPGWYSNKPVRLVLQLEDGQQAYADINVSGTNMMENQRGQNKMETFFLTTDPHEKYDWSTRTWMNIGNGDIEVGMSQEMVRFSWSEPKKIEKSSMNPNSETWYYLNGETLVFEYGVLVRY